MFSIDLCVQEQFCPSDKDQYKQNECIELFNEFNYF